MPALDPGAVLPPFSIPDASGTPRTLADLAGPKGLVLYFYPKDDTPGCTKEACEFRDLNADIRALGYGIAGVSADGTAAHAKFAGKFNLNFPLLADTEKVLIEAAGAWGEKNMYGKVSFGIKRTTLVVNAQGRVLKTYNNVRAEGHAAKVAADLKTLEGWGSGPARRTDPSCLPSVYPFLSGNLPWPTGS